MFPDPRAMRKASQRENAQLRRECRGLLVDHDGNILARRFPKFFSLGEAQWEEQTASFLHVWTPASGSTQEITRHKSLKSLNA